MAINTASFGEQAKTTQSFYFYSYTLLMAMTATEILFLGELCRHLSQKFSILNANIFTANRLLLQRPYRIQPDVEQKRCKSEKLAKKVTDIIDTHQHLSTISRKLNNAFGFPAFVTTTINFQMATMNLYYALQLSSLPATFTSVSQLLASLIMCVIKLFEISIICKSFHNIADNVSFSTFYT